MDTRAHNSLLMESFYVDTSATFKFNWYWWRFLGMHPTKRLKYFYYIYSIVLNIMITTFYPTTLVIQVFLSDSMKQLLEALTLTTTNVVNSCKQFNAFIHRSDLLAMHEILKTLDTRTQDRAQKDVLEKMMKKSYRVFRVCFTLFTSTGFLSEVATVFSSHRRLMYPAWFPFDWRASDFNYAVANAYQFVGIMIGTVQEATNDTFPALYMAVLTAHMQTLMMRIRQIGTERISKSLEENYDALVACVRDYQLLNRYYKVLQRVASYGLILQFFATGIVACITAVYVLFSKGTLFDMIYLGFYFACILCEILMSCYYGNELMYESRYITEAIYTCNWIEQNQKFKKVLIIFMQMSQREMAVKAGGLVIVNLPSFMSVLKTSYSFFAVLIKVT